MAVRLPYRRGEANQKGEDSSATYLQQDRRQRALHLLQTLPARAEDLRVHARRDRCALPSAWHLRGVLFLRGLNAPHIACVPPVTGSGTLNLSRQNKHPDGQS